MSIELQVLVQTVVQVRYPGGLEKWEEDGGVFGLAPGTPVELVVRHPSIPIDIKNMITQICEQARILPRFVTTLNFEGYDPEEFREQFLNHDNMEMVLSELGLNGAVKCFMYTLFNVFQIVGAVSTKENAEALVEKLRVVIPGCLRSYVMYGDDKVLRAEYSPDSEPFLKLQAVLELPTRTTVISEDDILNLRIALETQSVDDFINTRYTL